MVYNSGVMGVLYGLHIVGAFALVIATGCRPGAETVVFAPDAEPHALGPVGNAEDQYRFIWSVDEKVVPSFVENGLNTFVGSGQLKWDVVKGEAKEDIASWARGFRKKLDFYRDLDAGFIMRFAYGWDKGAMAAYPRIRRDGSVLKDHVDAANLAYLDSVCRAVSVQTAAIGDHLALIGSAVESETRGTVEPSFTPQMAAAYRKWSGRDIPEGTKGRNPCHWSKIAVFPVKRVVDDNFPLLDFYRWQWRAGDGWTDYLDEVAKSFRTNCNHRVLTMYDPALRDLPQWGDVGPEVTHLNHWIYPYPEPYRIGYEIAELQARARGVRGQRVLAMVQAISYRSLTAPIGEHPPKEPAWTSEFPVTKYPTTAPDLLQEAVWIAFSRQVDGIGFHGWDALYDRGIPHKTGTGYMCTNPETIGRIGRIFHEVGQPLGPLFRAVPERRSGVAVFESCASQVLGAHITYSVHTHFAEQMVIAEAANLSPSVLFSDEIVATGIPADVKTLILPKTEVVTKSELVALRVFQSRGGRIVADAELTPAIRPDAVFQSIQDVAKNMKGDFDDGVVRKTQDAEVRDHSVKTAAAKLKAQCGVDLFADSDNPDILVHARTWKDADYVFAVNCRRTFGDYIGPWRRVMEKGLPNAGKVIVGRKAGAVYDLVRHREVSFSVVGGKTVIEVDYTTNDGRVFLLTSRPLGALKVQGSGSTVVVCSDDDVLIPIRVDGFGKGPYYGVVRDGRWEHDFKERPVGNVCVTCLADGQISRPSQR